MIRIVRVLVSNFVFGVQGLGLGFRVWGSGFRISKLGVKIYVSGFEV